MLNCEFDLKFLFYMVLFIRPEGKIVGVFLTGIGLGLFCTYTLIICNLCYQITFSYVTLLACLCFSVKSIINQITN
jgi:hypothetical protein